MYISLQRKGTEINYTYEIPEKLKVTGTQDFSPIFLEKFWISLILT